MEASFLLTLENSVCFHLSTAHKMAVVGVAFRTCYGLDFDDYSI